MLLAATLLLVLQASKAVSGAVQSVLAAAERYSTGSDVLAAFNTATVSPLETRGPFYLENYSSELYLAHSPTNPDDVDYAVSALPYTSEGATALQWYLSDHSTPSGRFFSIHTNSTTELGVFVNESSGNTLTIGTLATQFNLTNLKPITYRITLPPTTLALTAPDTAGSPLTLKEVEEGSLAQNWHVYDVPST